MRKREQEQEKEVFLFKRAPSQKQNYQPREFINYTYLGSELILSSSSVFFSSSSPMTKCASLPLTNTKEVTRIRERSRKVLVDTSVKDKCFQ